jgi:NAD+ synthase (glutamine-hydrolysing)
VAHNLGVRFHEVSIIPLYNQVKKILAPAGPLSDLTLQNLQARLRGLIHMTLSNQSGSHVLATGNKSERATGYCTLYGDTVGAFAPLADVYKTQVYEIAAWFNKRAGQDIIPASVLERAPSAELRAHQTDQDTLPPYPELDRILSRILEGGESIAELVTSGEDAKTVAWVVRALQAAEFKRRQGPLGPTISERPLQDLVLPVTKQI